MTKENIEEPKEVVENATIIDNEPTTVTEDVTPVVEPVEQPKPTKKRGKKAEPEITIEVETPTTNSELEALKAELEAMKAEKAKLEEERTALNETVTKLQEEVKITPQKLGKAIQEMGVTPLTMSRENNSVMTIEAYNSMSDTQRRDWQRSHRSEFLAMMHNIKLH